MPARKRWLVTSLALGLFGCARIPDLYAPPIERKPLTGPEQAAFGSLVRMSDSNADAYIVRDISRTVESGGWRWVNQRPELRFWLQTTENLKFVMDFAVAETTFRVTGPIKISVFVNDQLLDVIPVEKPGDRSFEKPVPRSWLRTDAETKVVAEVDKPWVAPADGAKLGFTLSRAGFVQ
jgi:hypothetical protein